MLDELDRRLIAATQGGLPLVPRPYEAVAAELGVSADWVTARLRTMLDQGLIRRIGAVPDHMRLGYTANGMSVWDVPDEQIDALGEQLESRKVIDRAKGILMKLRGIDEDAAYHTLRKLAMERGKTIAAVALAVSLPLAAEAQNQGADGGAGEETPTGQIDRVGQRQRNVCQRRIDSHAHQTVPLPASSCTAA